MELKLYGFESLSPRTTVGKVSTKSEFTSSEDIYYSVHSIWNKNIIFILLTLHKFVILFVFNCQYVLNIFL